MILPCNKQFFNQLHWKFDIVWAILDLCPPSWIDWVDIFHPVMHASSYEICPCKGYGVEYLWLLALESNTGGDKRYENHRHKCATSNTNTSKIEQTHCGFISKINCYGPKTVRAEFNAFTKKCTIHPPIWWTIWHRTIWWLMLVWMCSLKPWPLKNSS